MYLNGERVAVNNLYNTNHGQYYYGSDILGSVKFITGQGGQEVRRIEYDVFGGIYKGNSPYGLETGYTGKPYDSVTGLSDYGFRDYSPTHARFITEDPIRDGENWFAYVGNNPVNWVDPWGLSASDGKKNGLTRDQILDTIQTALNMVGLIPGVGEIADVANSVISLARGNYIDAAFSVVSMVPTIGDYIEKSGKVAKFIEKRRQKMLNGGGGQKTITAPNVIGNKPKLEKTGKPLGRLEIPVGWESKTSRKNGGVLFYDPKNPHNNIWQMPGNPQSPNLAQRNPYIVFKKNGITYDVNGQPLKSASEPAAHIPLESFDMSKMPKF